MLNAPLALLLALNYGGPLVCGRVAYGRPVCRHAHRLISALIHRVPGAGCREVPPHMNDRNLREPSRFHEENKCASDYDMIGRYW
jgi:hypothetical protein